MGFGTGGRWDELIDFFEVAWTNVLDKLEEKFKV
jgi:hypothetical protein